LQRGTSDLLGGLKRYFEGFVSSEIASESNFGEVNTWYTLKAYHFALLLIMIPLFCEKRLSCADLDLVDGDCVASTLGEVVEYLEDVERVAAFCSSHWHIHRPGLALRLNKNEGSWDMSDGGECLLEKIDTIYRSGGFISSVDCQLMNSEIAILIVARISAQSALYDRQMKTKSVSFNGVLRTQSSFSSVFEDEDDNSLALRTKSLDLSGNKLRDQILAVGIRKLMDKNRVESLDLDDNVIGSRSSALLW